MNKNGIDVKGVYMQSLKAQYADNHDNFNLLNIN